MKDFSIRTAKESDAPAISLILRSLGWFENLADENFEETIARVSRHISLCKADNSHTILVADSEDGRVVGYASIHWLPYLFLSGPEGYLSELFVDESYRGQGVGSMLFQTVLKEAESRGCSRIMLANNRLRESYKRGFYLKQGCVEREEITNFIYKL